MSLLPFIASGIGLGAVYALSSVGLVILYRASGTLNFAFGAFGGVSAFLAWELDGKTAFRRRSAGLSGSRVSTAIAYGYGRVFAPRLAHRDRVVRAIATLGLALFLFGGMALYWGVGVARRLVLPTDFNLRLAVRRQADRDAADRARPVAGDGGRHRAVVEPHAHRPWHARAGQRPAHQCRHRRARYPDRFASPGWSTVCLPASPESCWRISTGSIPAR